MQVSALDRSSATLHAESRKLFSNVRPALLGALGVLMLVAVAPGRAQDQHRTLAARGHGLAADAECVSPICVGESIECKVRIDYNDTCYDTIRIHCVWAVIDPAGAAIRVPLEGCLSVLEIADDSNTTAQLGQMTEPFYVGPPGSANYGLPGLPNPGSVWVGMDVNVPELTYVVDPDDPQPLSVQIWIRWEDMCDHWDHDPCDDCPEDQITDWPVPVAVDILPAPECNINDDAPDEVCEHTDGHEYCGPDGMATYQWTITGNGVIVPPDDEQCVTVNALDPGSFTLTLVITDDNACENECTKTVTVHEDPECNINDGPDEVCEQTDGHEYCGPDGMATYQWTIVGDGEIVPPDDEQCVIVNALDPGSFTLTLVITDDNACENECSKTVPVNQNPTCNINGDGPDAVCENTDGHEYCGPPDLDGYKWWVKGDAQIVPPDDEQCVTVNALGAGSFMLGLTVTDENGCDNGCTKTVPVHPNPVCEISGPDEMCVCTQAEFCGPPGMDPYEWSITGAGEFVAPDPDNQQCVTVHALESGSFTLTLKITDDNDCESTCTKTVTVHPNPVCSITGPDEVCENTDGHEYCGPPDMTYEWSITGNGVIVPPNDEQCVTVNSLDPGSFTLTLKITDSHGCENDCDKTVPVLQNPACSIDGPDEVCEYTNGHEHCGPPDMETYKWTITGNGEIVPPDDEQCVTVNALGQGAYTLTLEITDVHGCGSTCSKRVTVYEKPECYITGPDPVCENTPGYEYCAPPGMATYAWSIIGDGEFDPPDPGNQQCVTVKALDPGSFTLTVDIIDNSDCQNSCSETVDVLEAPACSIDGLDAVCEYTNEHEYCGPPGMKTHKWTITGNGEIVPPDDERCATVNALGSGTFTLTLEITDQNDCDNECTKPVTVYAGPECSPFTGPGSVPEHSGNHEFCGPPGMAKYEWWISGDGEFDPPPPDDHQQCVTVNALDPGSFTLTLRITDGHGCQSECEKPVTVGEHHGHTVPTVSEWGLIIIGLLLLTGLTIALRPTRARRDVSA